MAGDMNVYGKPVPTTCVCAMQSHATPNVETYYVPNERF